MRRSAAAASYSAVFSARSNALKAERALEPGRNAALAVKHEQP